MVTQLCILFVCSLYLLQIGRRCMSSVCLQFGIVTVLAILIPMLFFQYGVVDVFPDGLGIDNSAASSITFVTLASLVSIYVHSMLVVAVVMCSRLSSQFGTETLLVVCLCCISSTTER